MSDVVDDEPDGGKQLPVPIKPFEGFPSSALPPSDLLPPVLGGFRAVELYKKAILSTASAIEEMNLALEVSRLRKATNDLPQLIIAWSNGVCNLINILDHAAKLESQYPEFFLTPQEKARPSTGAVSKAVARVEKTPTIQRIRRKKKDPPTKES